MQSSSIFSIEEIDAAELFQQEDFEPDFTDNGASLKGSKNVATRPAPGSDDKGFKKFNFKPTLSGRSPRSENTDTTPNTKNDRQGQKLKNQLRPSCSDAGTGPFKPQTAKCADPVNVKNGFQRFDTRVLSCSPDIRGENNSEDTRTGNSSLPTRADSHLNQRQPYLSTLANLSTINSTECEQGPNGVKSTASSTHGAGPARFAVQNGQQRKPGNVLNGRTISSTSLRALHRLELPEQGFESNVMTISSTGLGAQHNSVQPKEDVNRNVPDDARRGFQKFKRIASPQFLSPKRSESSHASLSTETDGDSRGIQFLRSSRASAMAASSSSDSISKVSDSNLGSNSVTLPNSNCSPLPARVSPESIFSPVSGSSTESDSVARFAPAPLLLEPVSPRTSFVPSAIADLPTASINSSPPFSLEKSSVLREWFVPGQDRVDDLSQESSKLKESMNVQLCGPVASRNGHRSCVEAQTMRPAGVSSMHNEGNSQRIGVTTSSVDGSVSHRTVVPSVQWRLRQISSIHPGVSPSTQFQKKNCSDTTPVNMQPPATGAGASYHGGNARAMVNSSRLTSPRGNRGSPYGPRTPVDSRRNPDSPSMNQSRQPWKSPRPGAPFSGQRYTPGRPRTPQVLSPERFSSPRQPVLTPRVAQLCKTPTGPGVGGQPRSSRKFPGPAGILPKLSPGEKLSNIDLSPPVDDEEQKEREEATKDSQGSSQPDIDDFNQGAWATMKAELGLDEGDPGSILAQHTIASVLKKASLKQLHRNKVPHLCVMVKTITLQASDAVVTFRDPTGEMNGTLHKRLIEEYQTDLKPGCVLLLKQVGVLSPSLRNHYLNVTHRNVVQIFPPENVLSQVSRRSTLTPKRTPSKSIRIGFNKGPNNDISASDKENHSSPPLESGAKTSPTFSLLDDAPVDSHISDRVTPHRGGVTSNRTKCLNRSPLGHSAVTPVTNSTEYAITDRVTLATSGVGTASDRGDVKIIPRGIGVRSALADPTECVTAGNSSSDRVTPCEGGSGLLGTSQKKRASEEFSRDRDKRVCVGRLQEAARGEKENVSLVDGTVPRKAVVRQTASRTDPVEENIAELIDGFEEELFADF